MNENSQTPLEERSRRLFDESIAAVDMQVRSRLTRARHAALEAVPRRSARLFGMPLWRAAAGATAAAVLAVALWFTWSAGPQAIDANDGRPSFEDLGLVASSDQGSGDAMEMMQNDVDFYAWVAAKAEQPGAGHAG
ncbi:MAG TPA: hypothetical protein VMV25_10790 [Steroidobacteraceae bacterium]|nr:hypothetical protein [Steroidobacteraceae bacterium]